jgi:hypothetical protein
LTEHLEEQLGGGLEERYEAAFVDDGQFVTGDLFLET